MKTKTNPAIPTPPEVNFDFEAALYFLSGGHYLFRDTSKKKAQSKFLTAADVAAAFSGAAQDTGWMPAGVVRSGYNGKGPWFVYSAPPQRVFTSIELPGQSAKTVHIPIPRTVMLVRGSEPVHIWALKSDHFDANALPFYAPFPNTYPDGHICWGSAKLPQPKPAHARLFWQLFFNASFNTHLSNGKSVEYPDDVCPMLIKLDGKRTYPLGDLVQASKKDIGAVIETILGGKS